MLSFLQVLKSKTVWTAILIAFFTTYDQDLQEWIAHHTGHAGKAVAFAMIALRLMTVGPVIRKKNGTGTDDSK